MIANNGLTWNRIKPGSAGALSDRIIPWTNRIDDCAEERPVPPNFYHGILERTIRTFWQPKSEHNDKTASTIFLCFAAAKLTKHLFLCDLCAPVTKLMNKSLPEILKCQDRH